MTAHARRLVGADLVTVLIPARNEDRSIAACLESVLTQDHRQLEILVVDGESEDRTREVVQRIASGDRRVRLLRNERRIIPAALNVGLASAKGRWLVRVDAHSTVPYDFVTRAVEHLRDERWGGVGGRKDAVGITPAGKAIAAALSSPFGVGGSVYHHGTVTRTVDHIPFGAYPTQLLRALGGWNERLLANEDFELDHRIREHDHELLFDPALRIAWRCRQSVPDLFRQYRRYGRGKATVCLLHPDSLRPRHLAPPAFIGLSAVAALLRTRRAVTLAFAPYVAFVLAASAAVSRDVADLAARVWLPLVFPAMHAGYGLGFWEGLLAELRRRIPFAADAPP